MTSEPYDRDTHTQIDRHNTHIYIYIIYTIYIRTYYLPTYIQTYIHTCIHVKFTVAVDCVCPHCCSVELAQLYVSLSFGHWACRLEPNVVERLVNCAQVCWSTVPHTCILTRPLDMLTIVVCMSSSKCWTLTVSMELTTIVG